MPKPMLFYSRHIVHRREKECRSQPRCIKKGNNTPGQRPVKNARCKGGFFGAGGGRKRPMGRAGADSVAMPIQVLDRGEKWRDNTKIGARDKSHFRVLQPADPW
jgi:hypothetical protein